MNNLMRTALVHVSPVVSLLVLLAAAGCSDEPGPLGIRLLPPRDSVRIGTTTVTSTSDLSFLYRINGASTSLLTGKSNGIEARTLLGYAGFSLIPANDAIDSVTLLLTINYRFLDSTGTLAFQVRKMLNTVSPSTFRWDSSTVPGVYSDTVSGQFIRSISPLDSVITLRLDTTLIRDWRSTNSGTMIFLPLGNIVAGFANGVNLFGDFRPLLTIYYHDGTGTQATLSLRSAWGIFVADGNTSAPGDRITVQSGISSRGIVRFDSLPLPALSSVTEATLQVALDTTQSLTNKFTVDRIDAYFLRSTSYPYDSLMLGVTLAPAYDNGQKVYRANVRFIVQQWLLRQTNRGILLRASGEQTTLDRFVLYGANAPATLKPKLIVTYTTLP